MLCLRPEVPAEDDDDFSGSYCHRSSTCSGNDYSTVPTDRRVSSSSGNYRSMWGRRRSKRSRQWSWSFSSNDGCSTYNSDIDQEKASGAEKGGKMCLYRSQLEQEVKRLQRKLQEEIDLHSTLASAVEQRNSTRLVESPIKLPDKTRELLDSVALLEIAVGKLEEEFENLQSQLSRERRERHEAECHSSRVSTHRPSLGFQSVDSLSSDQGLSTRNYAEKPNKDHGLLSMENLWRKPNRLSEEMVSCMRDIFLFLSDDESSKDDTSLHHQWKPPHYDSPMSFLASPAKTTTPRSPTTPRIDFGSRYSKAVQVSWLSVGRQELNYGADALKRFRFLVEQLAKVDPSCMSHDEKLAFWINLYNAMIMHAYLAYGIPRSDIKLLSLMQKATYIVGGHSITAADIEFTILKMKPPAHHPQIALCLALHKFEKFEEQEMYAIDHPEPLLTFALSWGMHSSPAVRIFKPETVNKQLKESLKDYVQASIGISPKGKVLVPKLLHSYAKGIVTDVSLPDWICQFLCSERAALVRACTSTRVKWRFLGAREFTVVPFDSRFRYLFLLD